MSDSVDVHHNPERLVTRIIRAYFDRNLVEVKATYEHHFEKRMEDGIVGSIGGACSDFLVRLIESCRTEEYV